MKYDFAIIGGDRRHQYIEQILSEKGYSVITYGCDGEHKGRTIQCASDAPVVVSGIPLLNGSGEILAMECFEDLNIETLLHQMSPGQYFFAGAIPDILIQKMIKKNIIVYDFMKNENLTLYNTIATAEGAIAEALMHQPTNLHRSECLILGYGKCAKVLAKKIRGMEANVTICARSEEDRSLAEAFGYNTLAFHNWKAYLGEFEYIFNTVPQVILQKDGLKNIRKDSIIIDIASRPGGVDYMTAKDLSIKTIAALGLPGKYAPKSTAQALVKCMLQNRKRSE